MGMTKEERKEYNRKYRIANKEKIKKNDKKYYEDNQEKIKEYRNNNKDKKKIWDKKYRDNNKEKINKQRKIYRDNNKEEIYKQRKIYRDNNKEEISKKKYEAKKIKLKINSLYKFSETIRSRIRISFKLKKPKKTEEILGCSIKEFKQHIENQFEDWMSWDNHGNWNGYPTELNTAWDLDHIIPVSSAKNEEEIIKLNHYSNFQPLCSYTNRYIKRDNII